MQFADVSGRSTNMERRDEMILQLQFTAGRVQGQGRDDIGRFEVNGQYNTSNRRVGFVKTYVDEGYGVTYRAESTGNPGLGFRGSWTLDVEETRVT